MVAVVPHQPRYTVRSAIVSTHKVPTILIVANRMAHVLQLFDLLGPPEFLPSRRITADLFGEICKTSPDMCVSVLTAIAGFNGKNINMTRMPDYVEYAPSGGQASDY